MKMRARARARTTITTIRQSRLLVSTANATARGDMGGDGGDGGGGEGCGRNGGDGGYCGNIVVAGGAGWGVGGSTRNRATYDGGGGGDEGAEG